MDALNELKLALFTLTGLLDDILNENDFEAYEGLKDNGLLEDAVLLNDAAATLIDGLENI